MNQCPNCGDLIQSFSGKCASCGTELTNINVSSAIAEFTNKISTIDSLEEKENIITSFPIPNTKEDILEFMILASSNIGYSNSQDDKKREYEDAWVTKFIQAYQKAKLVFDTNSELEKINKIFNETMSRLENHRTIIFQKAIIKIISQNIFNVIGILLSFVAVIINMLGDNSSLFELLSTIILIISAATLKKRTRDAINYTIAAISGLLLIILSFLLDNGALFELGGVIVIIIALINFIRSIKSTN